jgi:hypothetical protein
LFIVPLFIVHRDRWTIAGLALLGVLTLLTVLLYRSAPQSVSEASTESWLAARPNAVAPQLARARERLAYASVQLAAGNDSTALLADSVAADAAWRARSLAEDGVRRTEATTLWGEAVLAWAEILRRRGTGAGLRPDDDETLRRARELVDRALAVALPATLRARATTMRDELDQELRLGPLEWLPRR